MKSKTILSADEMLEILSSQWATIQDMRKAAKILDFERAAEIRDRLKKLREMSSQ